MNAANDGSTTDLATSPYGGGKKPRFYPINKSEIPTVDTLKDMFAPITSGTAPDVIDDKIYDQVTLTVNATNNFTFFATATTNFALSNMTAAGELPSYEAFYMTGIRFEVFNNQDSGYDVAEIKEILRQGYFKFTISNKPYIGNMYLLWFLNTIAPVTAATRFYSINPFKTWNLRMPLPIPPKTAFRLEGTLVTPSSFQSSATYYMKCILEGFRYRSIQ